MTSSNAAGSMDDRLFDLLADGELPDDRRRELLLRLEHEPGGWRRCAMAFLESQAWRSDLPRNDRVELLQQPILERRPSLGTSRNRRVAAWCVLSAALFLAFSLGWVGRGAPAGMPAVAKGQLQAPSTDMDSKRGESGVPGIERADETNLPKTALVNPQAEVRLAGTLLCKLDRGGESEDVEIPVLEGPGIDLRWLMKQPPAIEEPIRKELERRGHKVETRRQLLTVNLKDGRSVVVPFDQVQVKLAGRMFQ
ncbi:MAG: hypothetical protein EXS05_04285 [Planctomycetaceae bacterium]|nr:hypothetical protein [Planctomycetaceae bacterium]